MHQLLTKIGMLLVTYFYDISATINFGTAIVSLMMLKELNAVAARCIIIAEQFFSTGYIGAHS